MSSDATMGESVLLNAIRFVALLLVPVLILAAVSRLAPHPLKDFPGPVAARFTNGYSGFYTLKRRTHLQTYQNHLKYGPVVRQAPNRLSFNTVTALQDIYLNSGVTKGDAYLGARLTGQPNIFDTLGKRQHSRKRRAIGQALSERSMQSFEPTVISQVDVFLRELLRSSQKKENANMSQRCLHLGGDVIDYLAFGYPLNTQTETTNRPFLEAMEAINARVSLYMAWPTTSIVLDPLIKWLAKKRVAEFRKSVFAMIHARTAQGKGAQHDLYAMALSDKTGNGGGSSDDGLHGSELWAEATFFINAGKIPLINPGLWCRAEARTFLGGTTTATTMTTATFYLSCSPEVYKRLAAEIRTTFSSGNEICTSLKLSSCTYLRAVIDETLRIAPSSLGTLWRQQDMSTPSNAKKDFVVDGHVIPPGVQVGINPYTFMHNEEYYPEPFRFKPERWLGPEGSPELRMMRRAHAAFAFGERSCAGKAMAYLEISIMLAKMLWYFDFERAPGMAGEVGSCGQGKFKGEPGRQRKDEFQLFDVITAVHDGPLLRFKPRGDFWKDL